MCHSFASFFFQKIVAAARSRSPPRRRSIPKVRSYVPTVDRHLLRNKAKSYPRYRYDTTGTVDIINIMHTTRSTCTGRSTQDSRMPLNETGRRATRLPTGKGEETLDVCPFACCLFHPLHSATCSISWSRDRRGLSTGTILIKSNKIEIYIFIRSSNTT